MEVKRTSFNLAIDVHNKLKMIAMARNITQSQLIDEYLKEGIAKDIELVKNFLE
jgi:predicted DNA-binding ribbon-helix-helix protein